MWTWRSFGHDFFGDPWTSIGRNLSPKLKAQRPMSIGARSWVIEQRLIQRHRIDSGRPALCGAFAFLVMDKKAPGCEMLAV